MAENFAESDDFHVTFATDITVTRIYEVEAPSSTTTTTTTTTTTLNIQQEN
jgi:hypothetical protein